MSKISVIIPAYNVEDYIKDCILSVLNQEYDSLEVIVINDGSTDHTLQKINEIKNENLIILNQENKGVTFSRKKGVEYATGEYVFFLDGDDQLTKNALEDMYQEVNGKDVLLTDFYLEEDGHTSYKKGYRNQSGDDVKDILLGNINPTLSQLFKRELFTINSIEFPLSCSMGEDLFLKVQLLYYAKEVNYMRKASFFYCKRDNSVTKKYTEKMYDIFVSLEGIKSFLSEQGVLKKYTNEYWYAFFIHCYLSKVIVNVAKSNVHKAIYLKCKECNEIRTKNSYIENYIKSSHIYIKLLLFLYEWNYHIGVAVGLVFNTVKKAYVKNNRRVKELLSEE